MNQTFYYFQNPHLPAATATLVGLLLSPYLSCPTIHPAISVGRACDPGFPDPVVLHSDVVLHRATSAKRMTRDSNNETEKTMKPILLVQCTPGGGKQRDGTDECKSRCCSAEIPSQKSRKSSARQRQRRPGAARRPGSAAEAIGGAAPTARAAEVPAAATPRRDATGQRHRAKSAGQR